MRVAVIQFPGSNCDRDALHALRDDVGVSAELVWHTQTGLDGFDGVFVPGGFSFGDYLRCGAMAARSPIMAEVRRMAERGTPVIGVCNGFQILCEAGLLPGALVRNEGRKFVCRDVWVAAANRDSVWTQGLERPLRLPVAHAEGRYVCEADGLTRLEAEGRVAFRYVPAPSADEGLPANPNGSVNDIAGVLNAAGNVLGLMPHPERATRAILGGEDGLALLRAFTSVPRR